MELLALIPSAVLCLLFSISMVRVGAQQWEAAFQPDAGGGGKFNLGLLVWWWCVYDLLELLQTTAEIGQVLLISSFWKSLSVYGRSKEWLQLWKNVQCVWTITFFFAVSVVGCKGPNDVLHSLGVNCCEILTYPYTISMLLHPENIMICLTNTV